MVALSSATFKASSHDTKLSFANHLYRHLNVKGFGALGNGTNDDTNAIQSAVNWTTAQHHGTVYFPKGTYRITQPITVGTNAFVVNMAGEPGTVIIGDFGDYLVKYLFNAAATSGVQRGVIERLTLINEHASGGGIRYGTCTAGMIRDCTITANQGINTSIADSIWIAFEVSIINCHLDPGDNPTNSNGILMASDGPISNCTMTGFACGARTWAGQGCAVFNGCTFELCTVGYSPGTFPSGVSNSSTLWNVLGCRFVNCGTAILGTGGGGYSRIGGVQIEAAEGAIAGDPQYGLRQIFDSIGVTLFAGINIEGEYDVAGITFPGGAANNVHNFVAGVGSVNDGVGVDWIMPATGTSGLFVACNTPHVITTVPSGAANLREGDTFNVSNSNTAVWGATYATGGSNRVKVRYNGTNWTVVGA